MTSRTLAELLSLMSLILAGCSANATNSPPLANGGSNDLEDVPAESAQSETAANSGERVINSIGMEFVLIPAGEFLMGSSAADGDAQADEQPRHRVRISRPFYMGVYEVTQGEFEQVMGHNPSFFAKTGPGTGVVGEADTSRRPVDEIRWTDAVEFCRRLSALPEEQNNNRSYQLPTEAEWEYACRAGTETAFHFGDSLSAELANFNGKYPHGDAAPGVFRAQTTPVGTFTSNAFGLYDMHGNVWEWCRDWYSADEYSRSSEIDPQGPDSGSSRVIRGGGWYSDARDCRSAFRHAEAPDGVFYVMGFRVVMTRQDAKTIRDTSAASRDVSSGEVPRNVVETAGSTSNELDLSAGEEWPHWRGPRSDGSWQGPELPDEWPASGLKQFWQQEVGGGYAGVAAADGRVFTMDRQTEPVERERILCFDAAGGERLWSHEYGVEYGDLQYGNGPRSTPTVAGDRVYTVGAVGHVHCLDAAGGDVVWSWYEPAHNDDNSAVPTWGFAASPVIFENLVVVEIGGEAEGCLIALDRATGKVVWQSVPDPAGYATPMLIERSGRQELVCWTPTHVRGLKPRSGEILWSVPFEVTYGTSIAMPIFREGIVLVSGYWEGSRAIRLENRLGDNAGDAELIWEDRRNIRALMSQPLYRDGYAYLLDKRHGLTCFKLSTGEKIWDDQNRMTPKGRNPQATMVWLADDDPGSYEGDAGRAIILNSEGELILARLSPDGYHEQSRTKIIGPTWAHPAYAWDRVYARNDTELVSVSLLKAN